MSDYPYPPDEFDQPVGDGQSVGIHRTPRSAWSKVWPFLAVIVAFAVLAWGIVWWFASQSPDSEPTASPTVTQEQTDETEGEATEEPTDEETDEATDEATDEPTDEPTVELDRGVAIRVLNATSTSGLAASGVERLTQAGWTAATAANYTGGAIDSTVVWYQSEDYAAEAEQIAADLGVTQTELVPSLVGPVSVILAGDFSG